MELSNGLLCASSFFLSFIYSIYNPLTVWVDSSKKKENENKIEILPTICFIHEFPSTHKTHIMLLDIVFDCNGRALFYLQQHLCMSNDKHSNTEEEQYTMKNEQWIIDK